MGSKRVCCAQESQRTKGWFPLKSSHRLRMCTVHLLCLDHQVELWEEWPWTLPSLSSREIHFSINTHSIILRVISTGSFSVLVVNLRPTVTLHSYSEMGQRLWFKAHTRGPTWKQLSLRENIVVQTEHEKQSAERRQNREDTEEQEGLKGQDTKPELSLRMEGKQTACQRATMRVLDWEARNRKLCEARPERWAETT